MSTQDIANLLKTAESRPLTNQELGVISAYYNVLYSPTNVTEEPLSDYERIQYLLDK